ncbi:hypothetical protein KP509_16G048700 [Ceratopteris richardii]|uniref:Retrovirus-related Pol polyprotein from transposon TNT 1-94 n=1 Tax=Ceratopteris richardii TaxID=49495 RepID=A0A8T2SYN9_CERRI|nr:hypothetical protein KP509_16G048700 [Ceratopteris richardii]
MADLGVVESFATTIFTYSQSALEVARNPVFHARTKHIEVHYHYVRERFSTGEIRLAYVPTQKNIADLFTKALPRISLKLSAKLWAYFLLWSDFHIAWHFLIHECQLLVRRITLRGDLLIYLGSDVCEHTRTAGALFFPL